MFRKISPMTWFAILVVIAVVSTLGMPPDPHTLQQLHISSAMYRVAIVLLLIPIGVIWYAAFFAYARLKEYTRLISGSADGKAFRNITIGMGVLAFGLILPTLLSQLLDYIAVKHTGFKPSSIIIENYFSLVLSLAALIYLNNGSHMLTNITKSRPGLGGVRMFALLFIALGTVFTYLVINYHTKHNVYYLNTPLLLTTFVIPNLFGWFVALLSAYEFGLYARFVKGSVYRKALRQFSRGIVVAIAASVAGQFVDNTFAEKVSHSLGAVLLVEYALLVVLAAGLILMALGSKKLKKIEEA